MGEVMSRIEQLVRELHDKYELPVRETPGIIPPGLASFRQQLLEDEVDELWEAVEDESIVDIADSLGDVLIALYGTALTYGIDLDAVAEEIHRSNMTKQAPAIRGGKLMKGEGYDPPHLVQVLFLPREK